MGVCINIAADAPKKQRVTKKRGKELKMKVKKTKNKQKRGGVVKRFRLSGKHLFLTYAKLEQEKEEVLLQLRERLRPRLIDKYVISEEEHEDGSKHIHAYLELDKRCDIRAKERLDIRDEKGEERHGNYQSCRSYMNVIGYVVKEGLKKVLTNKKLDELGREIDGWGEIVKIAESGDYRSAMERIKDRSPRTYVMDYSKVKGNVKGIIRDATSSLKGVYDVSSFEVPEEVLA